MFILVLCLCLSTYMCMYHVCAWFLQKAEEGLRTPGTRVTHVCVLPHGYLELKLGLLQEHQVFLVTETSLQSKAIVLICLLQFLSMSRSINTLSSSELISPFIPTQYKIRKRQWVNSEHLPLTFYLKDVGRVEFKPYWLRFPFISFLYYFMPECTCVYHICARD